MNEHASTDTPGPTATALFLTGPHGNRPVTALVGWAHRQAANR
jgi:hypothetical protein